MILYTSRWFFPVACLALVATPSGAVPLGLTFVTPNRVPGGGGIIVNEGTAYISRGDGVYTVNSSGVADLIVPAAPSPALDTLFRITRPVVDVSGNVIFAAGFNDGSFSNTVWALYDASDASTPVVVWDEDFVIRGVDRNRRAVGFIDSLDESARFFSDGTYELLPTSFLITDVSASGVLGGFAPIPGTAGAGPALLNLDGTIELLDNSGDPVGVRDREDGAGVNAGFIGGGGESIIRYGNGLTVSVDESLDPPSNADGGVGVSESDFAIVSGPGGTRAYFPGINPLGEDRSVDLVQFFPELQSVDGFLGTAGIASSDGRLHIVVVGAEGLSLFVAPDPTVVPEPATLLIALICCVAQPRRTTAR